MSRLFDTELRRLGAYLLLGLLAAVVTGPEGSSAHPLDAIRASIVDPSAALWLAGAVGVWLVVTYGGQLIRVTRERATRPLPALEVDAHRRRALRYCGYLALLTVAILYPMRFSGAAQTALVDQVGIYALLALGLNVVVGYAGLLDLGYVAFFAVGAYVTAYFTSQTAMPWHAPFVLNPFFLFPIAAGAAALAGVLLGGPTLRLRGDYLAIVTLGFGEIVQVLARNADGFTNGPRGVFGLPKLHIDIGPLRYSWGLAQLPYYYLLLGFVVMFMVAFRFLEDSRVGRAFTAIREDEVAAAATGIPTTRYKVLAFAIGASTSGFAGVLFSTKQYFDPSSFSLQASILVLTVVIFGGMGSLFGVVAGAVVLQGASFLLRAQVPPQDRYIYFGAIVIVMMAFRPQGLIASKRRSRELRLSEAGIGAADALGVAEGVGV